MDIKGICTALPAIFDHDRQLDLNQAVDCIKLLIQTGSTTLVLFDQAGEVNHLDQEEEKLLLDATGVICRSSQTPLVVVNTRPSTAIAVKWAKRIQQSGAQAMVIVPPAQLDPHSAAMCEYLDGLCEAVELPVLIQNLSRGSRHSVPVSLLCELADRHSNLSGFIVESIPSGPEIDQLLLGLPHDRQVFLGNQPQHLTEAFHRGCAGAIAGPAVQIPCRKLWDALQQGDYATAAAMESKLLPLLTVMGQDDLLDSFFQKSILQQLGLLQHVDCRHAVPTTPVTDMLFQQAYSQAEDLFQP